MGTVLEAIGDTPIAELRKVAPPGCARIVAKLEWGNPTGTCFEPRLRRTP